MKKIAFFCIPATGHTNPMLPVAAELVKRGNVVRFYSFDEFKEKIEATGAEFISCTRFLPELTAEEEQNLKNVSTTEMAIQDIRATRAMLRVQSAVLQIYEKQPPRAVRYDCRPAQDLQGAENSAPPRL